MKVKNRTKAGIRRCLLCLCGDRRGVAGLELALCLPLLALLLLGVWEVSRAILIETRVNATAARMGGLVGREANLTRDDLRGLLDSAPDLNRTELGPNGVMIVSAVTGLSGGRARVAWQEPGAGTLEAGSRIGQVGTAALLPEGLTLGEGETVIVVEIFFEDRARVDTLLGPRSVYRASVHRSRHGDSINLANG